MKHLQRPVPYPLYRWVITRQLREGCIGIDIAGLGRAIVSRWWACLANSRLHVLFVLVVHSRLGLRPRRMPL
jgi:hypothetical protein